MKIILGAIIGAILGLSLNATMHEINDYKIKRESFTIKDQSRVTSD